MISSVTSIAVTAGMAGATVAVTAAVIAVATAADVMAEMVDATSTAAAIASSKGGWSRAATVSRNATEGVMGNVTGSGTIGARIAARVRTVARRDSARRISRGSSNPVRRSNPTNHSP